MIDFLQATFIANLHKVVKYIYKDSFCKCSPSLKSNISYVSYFRPLVVNINTLGLTQTAQTKLFVMTLTIAPLYASPFAIVRRAERSEAACLAVNADP